MKNLKVFLTANLIIFFSTVYGQSLPKLNAQIKTALIDSLVKALGHYYVFPEKAKIASELIKDRFKNGAYDTITDANRMANVLMRDFRQVSPDKHLMIRFDPQLEKRVKIFNKTAVFDSSDYKKQQRQNFFFKQAAILPGNIGYINFTNFPDTGQLSRKIVRSAMQFVALSDALIIDLRNNFGGSGPMTGEINEYFFNKRTYTDRNYNRITDAWQENWVENHAKITDGIYLGMPIYILTSNRTFSAAEGLAYNLQQLRRAKIVGDTTSGGAHASRSFALGNGFVAFIPFSRTENVVTKTDWEGTGVIPNIAVNEKNALETVQEKIISLALSNTKDETENRKLQWLLNDLKTKSSSPIIVRDEVLKKYTGQFEEYVFTFKENQLYCLNTHQKKGEAVALIPISYALFKIDATTQVEFINNGEERPLTIKLYWDDGWVDSLKRTN